LFTITVIVITEFDCKVLLCVTGFDPARQISTSLLRNWSFVSQFERHFGKSENSNFFGRKSDVSQFGLDLCIAIGDNENKGWKEWESSKKMIFIWCSARRLIGSLWTNIKMIKITEWFNKLTSFLYCLVIKCDKYYLITIAAHSIISDPIKRQALYFITKSLTLSVTFWREITKILINLRFMNLQDHFGWKLKKLKKNSTSHFYTAPS